MYPNNYQGNNNNMTNYQNQNNNIYPNMYQNQNNYPMNNNFNNNNQYNNNQYNNNQYNNNQYNNNQYNNNQYNNNQYNNNQYNNNQYNNNQYNNNQYNNNQYNNNQYNNNYNQQFNPNQMDQGNNRNYIGRSLSDKPNNNNNFGPSLISKGENKNNSTNNINEDNKKETKPPKVKKFKVDYSKITSNPGHKELNNNNDNHDNNNNHDNNDSHDNQEDINNDEPEIDNETPIINQKMQELFSDQNLSNIKSEQDLLNFFTQKEKECTDFINKSFNENIAGLKSFMNKKIGEIFNDNLKINDISKDIMIKIEEINIDLISNEEEYFNKMKELFGDAKLPAFLIERDLQTIKGNSISQSRNLETTTIIGKIKNREFSHNKNLIEYFESFRDNKNTPLNNFMNIKFELLYLFICVNNRIFHKSYCREPFLTFFEANENILKEFFGNNIKYKDISNAFLKLKGNQAIIELEKNYQAVEKYIKGEDEIYNIISSFYYLLLYKFKDSKQPNLISISNILVNLVLTNFVIFLDERLKQKLNLTKSLFDSLKELYLYDIHDLISKGLCRNKNKLYDNKRLDELLSKDGIVKTKYEEVKKQFPQAGFFTIIKKNLDHKFNPELDLNDFEKNLKLIPVEKNIYSNTITIIIDGFSIEDRALLDEWKEFVNYFPKETMFYFFKCALDTKLNLLRDGSYKRLKYAKKDFKGVLKKTEILGSLLACILYSKEFFRGFQINLVGYSFGNLIIKQCLKDLYKINNQNNFVKIKNVIFIGAPINFHEKKLWKTIIESLILDRLINCFSQADEVLKNLFKINMGKKIALGNEFAEILNDNGDNIISNFNFTQNQFNQFNYKKGVVAESIFQKYKNI